jgi:hypothetical protein
MGQGLLPFTMTCQNSILTLPLLFFTCLRSFTRGISPSTRRLTFRDTNLIGFATNLYDAVIVKTIRAGQPIPSSPFLHSDKELTSLRYTIEKCLFGANRRVIEQAKEWEMNFMAVSDLNGRTVDLSLTWLIFRVLVEACSGVKNPPHRSLSLSSKGQLLQVHTSVRES